MHFFLYIRHMIMLNISPVHASKSQPETHDCTNNLCRSFTFAGSYNVRMVCQFHRGMIRCTSFGHYLFLSLPNFEGVTSSPKKYVRTRQCWVQRTANFIQYAPKKPTKWEIKAFVLADSCTGYMLYWHIYTGIHKIWYM